MVRFLPHYGLLKQEHLQALCFVFRDRSVRRLLVQLINLRTVLFQELVQLCLHLGRRLFVNALDFLPQVKDRVRRRHGSRIAPDFRHDVRHRLVCMIGIVQLLRQRVIFGACDQPRSLLLVQRFRQLDIFVLRHARAHAGLVPGSNVHGFLNGEPGAHQVQRVVQLVFCLSLA